MKRRYIVLEEAPFDDGTRTGEGFIHLEIATSMDQQTGLPDWMLTGDTWGPYSLSVADSLAREWNERDGK